ncbi:uncharacterized protein RtGEF isoform X2 [Chironomus tepperi]|uniref:uncharacterized protein RtGEF isoform X2 n=1 Tax=Chironomus tepperi TaxID=113505 RepID=UPI00391F3EA4
MENTIVQADFSFKGSNNDELCFKKGDLIVLTNRDEDGAWWEGTAVESGMTGWFPSNYVSEYKTQPPTDVVRPPEEIQAFRNVVYNDLLDSERAHCAELRGLLENFLEPLETSQILNKDEFAQLISNFVEVVELHEELLKDLEECNDRVGKLFLSKAPTMKKIHQTYCAMHPKAIVIVDKYKENLNIFMENQGAAKPGILVLTTGLSKCFRRLEKYAAILQELQRHMEVSHPDRGDTQRSIELYKELAASVAAIRRQKELELQILTGPIRGWEGEELSKMGEIIHMGSCAVGKDHVDRYFILLEQNLLILSVSQRMSAFKFEGKIPVSGINAARLPDTEKIKNAFEINGPLIERIVAICQSTNEANKWVELLGKNSHGSIDIKRNTSFSSGAHLQPNKRNLLDSRGYCINSKCSFEIVYDFKPTLPSKYYPSASPYAALTDYLRELVQQKILTKFILKALLYPQFMKDIDTTEVKLRKIHKTVVRMYRHGTNSSSSSNEYSSEECNSSGHLERQNALDNYTSSGDGSKVYSEIKYKTGKDNSDSWNGTVYESFIDHGEDAGEIRYEQLHDSISSFCFVTECESPTRESFMIGSIPHRFIGDEKSDYIHDNKVHLSTAKIHLLDIKQKSEQSQNSSFEHTKLSGEKWKNMAYEDLLNIDDSIKPKEDNKIKTFQERHHSMPMQFVGNRFNVSSLTEIYIPSCKNHIKHENNVNKMTTPCNSFDDSEHISQVSHSNRSLTSQERVELTIPAINKITAEIIFDDNESSRHLHNISDIFLNEQATNYSSDSDSGIAAGSYTLSPSDQPFNYHRSFISHKSNPHALNSSLNDHIASNNAISDEPFSRCKQYLHDDSLEGDNRTKLVIKIESGKKNGSDKIFYSGLYAHWWKKEKLPTQMVEAISIASNKYGSNDDQHFKRHDRGSDVTNNRTSNTQQFFFHATNKPTQAKSFIQSSLKLQSGNCSTANASTSTTSSLFETTSNSTKRNCPHKSKHKKHSNEK